MRYSIFLVVMCVFSFGQQKPSMSKFEVNYLVKFRADTASTHVMLQEYVSLLIGDEESLFKSTQKAIYDSLTLAEVDRSNKAAKNGYVKIDLSQIPTAKFKPEVFKKGIALTGYNELLKTVYAYPIEEKIIWKILNETKTIQKYKCRKAIGKYKNREYIAWFSEEIPFSEGPYVFKGLPGLIVEVYDTKNYYHFDLIGFKKVEKPIIPSQPQIQTEYSKFVKARENFLADPNGVFESQTRFKIPAKDRDRLAKMHQSNNNFID